MEAAAACAILSLPLSARGTPLLVFFASSCLNVEGGLTGAKLSSERQRAGLHKGSRIFHEDPFARRVVHSGKRADRKANPNC